MKRVFSGVQPTGNIHIGNYLGALKQFVQLQDENDAIYCIVDMHAITVPQDPKELRQHILDVAALYMAVGVDPKKAIIFVQSDVPGHAELNWILTCNSYTGELSRMTQFKQKSKGRESAPTGLFTYPVLMASDILLYDTDIVPVGNDQKQHIELTRDIALRVNNKFGDTFVVPEGQFVKSGARVMSLDDPTSKMSKSAENPHSRISLLDEPSKIKKSIMKSTTDSEGVIYFDIENKPGISNLLSIYSAFSGETIEDLVKKYDGQGYGTLKKDLVEVTVNALAPVQERYKEIRYSQELIDVLKDGAERANTIAEKTMKRVKDRFGLGL
ncbi:MAG: tryptophan--tRNA ligase [Firmicutes bacterium]|nr:tryptophan--tRNA ligase [Bacillota bacterium]MBQ2270375.1 tryptophan--tRNA ligase [Bacillota bacterium]MBQ5796937.1 tryptophan--tRNA ligase [Bacillota bacterium]MBR5000639.1 tryptophan--tRNA ligase [Bacillota bacterium]MBR6500266.1 tryptophan--tRNA ligase [Bacillota bacterium]